MVTEDHRSRGRQEDKERHHVHSPQTVWSEDQKLADLKIDGAEPLVCGELQDWIRSVALQGMLGFTCLLQRAWMSCMFCVWEQSCSCFASATGRMVGRSQMGCIWTNPLRGPVPVEIWPVTTYKLRCTLASLKPDQWQVGWIETVWNPHFVFGDYESSAFLSFQAMFRTPFPLLVPCIGRQITWITESSLSSTASPELQEQHWNSQHNCSDFWDKVFQQFYYSTPGSQEKADPQHRVCILWTMYPAGTQNVGTCLKIWFWQ